MESRELRAAVHARKVASAYYLTNPRVTLIDVGWKLRDGVSTDELAVRVHVRDKPTGVVFEALSVEQPHLVIDAGKIPFQVDFIEATYPLQWFWPPPFQTDPRALAVNPLCGGISVSCEWLFGFGTLGGIVRDRDTHEPLILSNWHVLAASEYAYYGLRVFQPGYGDNGGPSNTVATLERHAFTNGIDAAVARLNGTRGWINNQMDIGPVTGSAAPALSMAVIKSGRASGVTYGVIDGFDGDYPIYYGGILHTIRHVHRIVPQSGRSEVSRGGDSGSWWLEQSSQNAVALHFAGQNDPETALAIAMPQVLDALNVEIVTTERPVTARPEEVRLFEPIAG